MVLRTLAASSATTCPFGVVERNPSDGRAFKCTFCYDRQKVGLEPACATACPTKSIQFGKLDELRDRAQDRLAELQFKGFEDAQLSDPQNSSVGGIHAFFIVRGDPRSYNLPPKPEVPTVYLKKAWKSAAVSAGLALGTMLPRFWEKRPVSGSTHEFTPEIIPPDPRELRLQQIRRDAEAAARSSPLSRRDKRSKRLSLELNPAITACLSSKGLRGRTRFPCTSSLAARPEPPQSWLA